MSRGVAKAQGWKWVSTGAFYRGLAVVARAKKVKTSDAAGLAALAVSGVWDVRLLPERTEVYLEGKSITDQVYSEDIGSDASIISQIPEVRKNLLQAQRDCAVGVPGLVAEGRDCGTVIFPDAQVKIYLTARSEHRFKRRAKEEGRSVEETRAAQTQRDMQDTTRASAPLQVPPGAIVVDTSEMDLPAVVAKIDAVIQAALKARP